MNTKLIAYWIVTAIVGLGVGGGGVADILYLPQIAETMINLGYPPYFARIIGVWKILALFALFAPGLPRLKEWAYAGLFFDLSGAFISHLMVGDGVDKLLPPIIFLALTVASWSLRPANRRLPQAAS